MKILLLTLFAGLASTQQHSGHSQSNYAIEGTQVDPYMVTRLLQTVVSSNLEKSNLQGAISDCMIFMAEFSKMRRKGAKTSQKGRQKRASEPLKFGFGEVTAAIKKPPKVEFGKEKEVKDSSLKCKGKCKEDEICKQQNVACIKAPCEPLYLCQKGTIGKKNKPTPQVSQVNMVETTLQTFRACVKHVQHATTEVIMGELLADNVCNDLVKDVYDSALTNLTDTLDTVQCDQEKLEETKKTVMDALATFDSEINDIEHDEAEALNVCARRAAATKMDALLSEKWKKCEQEKSKKVNEVCLLPKQPGRCRARKPRYYYDSKRQECLKFNYGGCGGNENNFKTESECKETCGSG